MNRLPKGNWAYCSRCGCEAINADGALKQTSTYGPIAYDHVNEAGCNKALKRKVRELEQIRARRLDEEMVP